ncbi:VPLPA-CTERM sorting domain-containing protein [Methylicorpusculum sp.]|uniref:VPLPA-CTERM sorting domain-containing protein n=1 Tax=Methylicorpusculum sp. TaxID=2713644 RepID=UPI0027235AD9|nr:VPLPA-CTERM sorting domain-containing protein [Methylicorpusculum sp.]MDO8846431.1 VPLPA-CTERM sorting domain-containing protein [Methylicorpusculum sp.]
MTQFKKLAIASAIAASLMSATSAEAHVTYHLSATGGEAPNVNGSTTTGSWTEGSPVDQGYVGNLPTTWLANIHHYNTVYEVSAEDAITNHGASNDFVLASLANRWNPTRSWGNALDYGLVNLEVAGHLTVTVAADSGFESTFAPGFTLWSGWGDAGTGNKHGAWNGPTAALPDRNPSNPGSLGVTGISYIGHAATSAEGGLATYTFTNLAAGQYSLWIGGNGPTGTTVGSQTYVASLTASPVPMPAAVWFMGSGLVGLVGLRRRTANVVA